MGAAEYSGVPQAGNTDYAIRCRRRENAHP